ncbi:uncharacterized protein TNCV_4655801 [Trichonephila clavipes]|nr:uncharacterized protein TNCV_4655801 [Trichonephila clavipes]
MGMVQEDPGAPSEGATYAWMAADAAVGCTRAILTMWRCSRRLGLGSSSGEDMDVCKCIVPLRHGVTLNSRRAASPLVWLVEEEKRWEASDHPQGFLPLNWGGTEQKRTVTCTVLKAKANDRRKISSP